MSISSQAEHIFRPQINGCNTFYISNPLPRVHRMTGNLSGGLAPQEVEHTH
jgi:hypothetical protein